MRCHLFINKEMSFKLMTIVHCFGRHDTKVYMSNRLRLPLQIPVKPKYRLGNFEKNISVENNVASGSSGSGDPMLWELRGERVFFG